MGRARPADVDAVDRQRRRGAGACDEPGAETEEGGSRTHAEQRGNDSAEDGAEDSDEHSAGLRRLAVGRDRTRDPPRHNSQDHPSGEAHCACTFDDAGHETSVHSQDQVAPDDRRCRHLGPYGVRPISPPTRTPSDGSGRPGRRIPQAFPESKWVSEPISARPAPEDTHASHRTSDRISHGASHTGLAMGAVAPVVHPPCRRPGPAPPVT